MFIRLISKSFIREKNLASEPKNRQCILKIFNISDFIILYRYWWALSQSQDPESADIATIKTGRESHTLVVVCDDVWWLTIWELLSAIQFLAGWHILIFSTSTVQCKWSKISWDISYCTQNYISIVFIHLKAKP